MDLLASYTLNACAGKFQIVCSTTTAVDNVGTGNVISPSGCSKLAIYIRTYVGVTDLHIVVINQ